MAASEVEDLKEAMQRFHPTSRPNRIAALGIGEIYSEAQRIHLPNNDTALEELVEASKRMRDTLSAAKVRASERTGNTYTVEVNRFLSNDNDIVAVALVTRTA